MPLRLILRNLFKRPLRFTLTALALMMAVFLVCVLQSLVVALDAGVRDAKSDRLVVQSAVSHASQFADTIVAQLRQHCTELQLAAAGASSQSSAVPP